MELVLRSPQLHSTFGSLGYMHADGYNINENCNATLETILHNILTEDKNLRTYRRNISYGQNINKDLIPLLIHTNEDATIELLIKILLNLTIPIECLLSVEVISKTDYGRHAIFEINHLLLASKSAFTDLKATKVIVDFLKKNMKNVEQAPKLSTEQRANISNSLLLLRNILHIPEEYNSSIPNSSGPSHTVQNQILWNIFSQSVEKALIKLMTISESSDWAVTMVQLIALLYKDQHVVTLHKLLNMWLEDSISESSEDNESNTSPPNRGSEDSSPMLTSDPTSDSSDTGASGKSNDGPNCENNGWDSTSVNNISENGIQTLQPPMSVKDHEKSGQIGSINSPDGNSENDIVPTYNTDGQIDKILDVQSSKVKSKQVNTSDCGYGTQIENQESVSTSSNEDELPPQKPVHQKPHNAKQRINTKARVGINLQEKKRKKLVKRIKTNMTRLLEDEEEDDDIKLIHVSIHPELMKFAFKSGSEIQINVQGLSHIIPTDDDISNILKEFTVDFLLKGYNSLVETLYNEILTNMQLEIDTSHFFWLVSYFLKFATQIEMDLEHMCSVLSFKIVSYLTAEGVNLCEQFELSIKLDGKDLKPSIRRLHLVVTAIREFVTAIVVRKKFAHICNDDREILAKLEMKMCEAKELRSLLVLLLRFYNPKYHTKQYLQDLIVTNHILLTFLDSVMKLPDYNGSTNMHDHIKQFATPEIMSNYGLMLENYTGNGEFVNDCIFTLMHHVGGELDCLVTLFQPKILKIFTTIWKSEFEISDDWSDLIEYVISTFIRNPSTLQCPDNISLEPEDFKDNKRAPKVVGVTQPAVPPAKRNISGITVEAKKKSSGSHSSNCRWREEELATLSWMYMQCSKKTDAVGEIVKMFKEDGIIKSRHSVVQELLKLNLINEVGNDKMIKNETDRNIQLNKNTRDELNQICEQLTLDGKTTCLAWVQRVLLETCSAKILMKKIAIDPKKGNSKNNKKINNYELFKNKSEDMPLVSSVAYHALVFNKSVPLVPWNHDQASLCKDLKFLQLLHKLGFHMPVDTGKIFIRIPNFWTADALYDVASRILPIDTSRLNFSVNDLINSSAAQLGSLEKTTRVTQDITMITTTKNFYQIHKPEHLTTLVSYTPMPGTLFNSEDHTKQNWLEVVQKSQECKITLNLGSNIMDEDSDAQSEVMAPLKATELLTVPLLAVDLMLPAAMCKQDSETLRHSECEGYNHSLCETASVASDLTRMYVSDEDEKELQVPPRILSVFPVQDDGLDDPPEKRPRIQYEPIFD